LNVRRLLATSLFVALAGCSHVAPYQRGHLAHPTMAPTPEDELAADHVHAIHEGAAGGGALVGSGCGCN
jgi:hypothetical protein